MDGMEENQMNNNFLDTINTTQNNPHHFTDVAGHTRAVMKVVADNFAPNAELAEAAMYHDIAKKDVKKVNEKTGYDNFMGHEDLSADTYLANTELHADGIDVQYVAELIRLHGTKYSKQGKIISMLENHKPGFAADLIRLQTADVLGQSEFQRTEKLNKIIAFAEKVKSIATNEQAVGLADALAFVKSVA